MVVKLSEVKRLFVVVFVVVVVVVVLGGGGTTCKLSGMQYKIDVVLEPYSI